MGQLCRCFSRTVRNAATSAVWVAAEGLIRMCPCPDHTYVPVREALVPDPSFPFTYPLPPNSPTIPYSIQRLEQFRNRVLIKGKALSGPSFEQRIRQGLLAGLKAEDGLFHRAFGDETVDEDSLGLSDTMGAVHRLALDCRVPPWVIEDHGVGGSQRQADTPCFQADQEDLGGPLLEPGDRTIAVECFAGQPFIGPSTGRHIGFDQPQHFNELREDQDLGPLLHQRLQHLQQALFVATLQHCRVHWMRNALAQVSRGQHTVGVAAIRQAFDQPDRIHAGETWHKVAEQRRPRWLRRADLMDTREHEVLAYMSSPPQHRTKLHSTSPIERLNKEGIDPILSFKTKAA